MVGCGGGAGQGLRRHGGLWGGGRGCKKRYGDVRRAGAAEAGRGLGGGRPPNQLTNRGVGGMA